jgi:hypothetical protein
MAAYLGHTLFLLVPYIALGVAGIAIFLRRRTVPAILIALGFGAAALSHILGDLYGHFLFGPSGFINSYGWIIPVVYWGRVGGMWLGSLSLLWHALLRSQDRP